LNLEKLLARKTLNGVEMMRKSLAIVVGLLIATLSSISATTPVHAYIYNYYWITPFYRGYDQFYGSYITAYETGSTAQLFIQVYDDIYNYPSLNITVTAVKVLFDWNVNYSSTECPYTMQYDAYHNFNINITVPPTNIASNMFTHSFTIYVEFTYDSSTSYWSYSGSYFAVYSMDQGDAMDAYQKLNAKLSYVPSFYSYEAQALLSKTESEYNIGSQYYTRGDFASAKTYYETGISDFDSAFSIESDYASTRDGLNLNETKADIDYYNAETGAIMTQANATMEQADAAMMEANATKTQADAAVTTANATLYQSYTWFLFGIGFIILSIGILVYAIRKPKTP
jgi:tetratricopeptide (TPR) repeat protein